MTKNMKLTDMAMMIRYETCKMLRHRGFGHLGGALSMVEVLAVLYFDVMNIDALNPQWPLRDYFILSKGHGGPSYYATLACAGYFDRSLLKTINENGTNIPSHPDRLKTIGVDATTGSLGQGISIAAGIAKGLKIQGKNQRVYTLVGDGECNEGQVWEAVQFIAHHQLDNLIMFVDDNKKQLDGYTQDINQTFDFKEKFSAFGLYTQRVDGKDVFAIKEAILNAIQAKRPSCIILDTIKGQGIPYFENLMDNHHIRFDEVSLKELDNSIEIMSHTLKELGYDC